MGLNLVPEALGTNHSISVAEYPSRITLITLDRSRMASTARASTHTVTALKYPANLAYTRRGYGGTQVIVMHRPSCLSQ